MITDLRYGTDASLSLELAGEALVAVCDAPRGQPLADVAAAVERACAAPFDYPPLPQAALPGDKVALALDHGVPQAAIIVERTIAMLLASGVSASDITLVRAMPTTGAAEDDPLAALEASVRQQIASQVHDPANRDTLSYLAAASDARPIYINRAIHDADLVISIGCLRLAESLGYYGISSSVYPAFSDAANIETFRSPKAVEPAEHARLRKQADEVSWLLGLRLTIQVVPGAGAHVLHVLAGDWEAVFREGSRLCDAAWCYPVKERASLVVAAIEGDAAQQTWESVARALAAASRVVAQDGDVALCTELAQRPGPALQHFVGAEDLHRVLREIQRNRPPDALAATELAHALERGKVYLVSRLDDELVEELGLLPVAAEQVSRLARRYDSCIVLANGQYAMAVPPADAVLPAANKPGPAR